MNDYPKKLSDFTEEATQENSMQLEIVSQDACNPDFWNHSKFEVFGKFFGFSTIMMEKVILKLFQNLRSKREKILTKELSENSKFERELKRLHFAVNYERGSSSHRKANYAKGKSWLIYESKAYKLEHLGTK